MAKSKVIMTKRDREYQKKQKKLEKALRKEIRDKEKKDSLSMDPSETKETEQLLSQVSELGN